MNLLLLGVSGYLGGHFLEHIYPSRDRFLRIVGTSRRAIPDRASRFPGVTFALCDLRSPSQLDRVMRDATVVMNFAGRTEGLDPYDFIVDNVYTVRNVHGAAERAGVRRVIHLGSVYASCLPETPYGSSKQKADEFIRRADASFQSVIVRTTWVVDRRDPRLARIVRLSRFLPFVFVPSGARTSPIHVSDLSRILTRLIDLELPGRVSEFDVCGEDALTLKESVDLALKAAGRRRVSIAVPIRLALLGSSILRTLTLDRSSRLSELDALLRSQLTDRVPARNDARRLVDRMTPAFHSEAG